MAPVFVSPVSWISFAGQATRLLVLDYGPGANAKPRRFLLAAACVCAVGRQMVNKKTKTAPKGAVSK